MNVWKTTVVVRATVRIVSVVLSVLVQTGSNFLQTNIHVNVIIIKLKIFYVILWSIIIALFVKVIRKLTIFDILFIFVALLVCVSYVI